MKSFKLNHCHLILKSVLTQVLQHTVHTNLMLVMTLNLILCITGCSSRLDWLDEWV